MSTNNYPSGSCLMSYRGTSCASMCMTLSYNLSLEQDIRLFSCFVHWTQVYIFQYRLTRFFCHLFSCAFPHIIPHLDTSLSSSFWLRTLEIIDCEQPSHWESSVWDTFSEATWNLSFRLSNKFMHLHLQLIVILVQTAFYYQPSNGHSHHRWSEAKFDLFIYFKTQLMS